VHEFDSLLVRRAKTTLLDATTGRIIFQPKEMIFVVDKGRGKS
jgi:hypothetical protein